MKKWKAAAFAALIGLIGCALPTGAQSADAESTAADQVTRETIVQASGWQEIYDALKSARTSYWYSYDYTVDYAQDSLESAASADSITSTSAYTPADTAYSTVNLRDVSVDEGDIARTDGSYIYIVQDETYLAIVKAAGTQSELVSRIRIGVPYGTDASLAAQSRDDDELLCECIPQEIYVEGDRLIVVSSESRYPDANSRYRYSTQDYAAVTAYDISDRAAPVCLGSIYQEGSYKQSRRMNGITYLYTTMWPSLGEDVKGSELGVQVNDRQLEPEQFYIPQLVTAQDYLVLSSVADTEPSEVIDSAVFVSGADQLYVSSSHIYVLNSYWNSSSTKTQISKFTLAQGQIEGTASCMLKGYVNNTWSIDEYDGYLRVLTTYTGPDLQQIIAGLLAGDSLDDIYYDDQWVSHNALFVLDEELGQVSRITGIAQDEEIQSARYFGQTAYFVTYQNTDPLFAVDLSDPAAPQILGELEVTGFSAYLHPWDEDCLLGIGYETDPQTGQTMGLKMSLFDLSDSEDIREISRYVISGITYCPAIEDYKSIFVDAQRSLVGFFYSDRYLLYRYDEEDGFVPELIYDFLADDLGGCSSEQTMRGLYIEDTFYLAGSSYVVGFDMKSSFGKNLLMTM